MGGGSWTANAFRSYTVSKGMDVTKSGSIVGDYSAQEIFKSRNIDEKLNPYNVDRECCDTAEHPNTIPVILALDVTGSMGQSAVEVAKQLNVIMTELYNKINDVEFMIMGIGDFSYDFAPLQVSQFESDIRIAEQLDKIYFEGGGGGNQYESYTAAWYFAARHTKLDCLKRGKKGILITMGDETLNPYLPAERVKRVIGDTNQADIETEALYNEVINSYDVYHLAVDGHINGKRNCYSRYADMIQKTFGKYLDNEHLKVVSLDNIAEAIIDIVTNCSANNTTITTDGNFNVTTFNVTTNDNNEITW